MKNRDENATPVIKIDIKDKFDYYQQGVWFTLGSVFTLSGLYILACLWTKIISFFI